MYYNNGIQFRYAWKLCIRIKYIVGDDNLDDVYKSEIVSLLWPDNCNSEEENLFKIDYDRIIKDLNLEEIFTSISINEDLFNVKSVSTYITDDINTIKYRLDITEYLLNNPDICKCLKEMLHIINELESYGLRFMW